MKNFFSNSGHFGVRTWFAVLVLLMVCCLLQGSDLPVRPGHLYSTTPGELIPETWKAKWIWIPGVSNRDRNHYMLARKAFTINEVPAEAHLNITADSHYKLWINGNYVVRGPARCSPHHQSYDILQVSDLLVEGENLIAVKVHYHGMMMAYYLDPYPGLLVQLQWEENGAMQYVVSDRSWKARRDFAWDNRTELVNRVNANNYTSSYNFNAATPGWQLSGFDDRHWQHAVYQTGPGVWPPKPPDYEPYAVQRPWLQLVPRDLPPLVETNIDAYKVWKLMEAPQYSKYKTWGDRRMHDALHHSMQDVYRPLKNSRVTQLDAFLKGEEPLIIENSYPQEKYVKQPVYHTMVVFDFEELVSGYPYIEAKGRPGTIIDINYVPYLVDDVFIPGIMLDTWADRLVLSGREDKWEGTELRPFRYMSLTVRGEGTVEISRAGVTREQYPFQQNGSISVPGDSFVEKLWKAGEKTIRAVTTDGYTDNYHENRQYVQTSYYASRGNYTSFFDTYLQRRYLIQHSQDQLPNGMIPMWAPWIIYEGNQQVPGIFEANHFWLMGLRDYFLHTGDTLTTGDLLMSAERCALAINRMQLENNLIHKPPYPYWIDWAKLAQGDQNFIINALQLLAFRQYAELLTWLDSPRKAARWNREADLLAVSLARFWDEEAGLFADNLNNGVRDKNFSEHANSLAIVTGVAGPEQVQSILDKLINNHRTGVMEEATLFNYWVAEALAGEGKVTEAIDMLRRKYSHMLEDELGTLWENPNLFAENVGDRSSSAPDRFTERSWSAAQAENAFPPNILSRYILGLHPTAPGMSEMRFSGFLSPYPSFSGTVPTPHGDILVGLRDNRYELNVPAGINVWMSKKELEDQQVRGIVVNGTSYDVTLLDDRLDLGSGGFTVLIQK